MALIDHRPPCLSPRPRPPPPRVVNYWAMTVPSSPPSLLCLPSVPPPTPRQRYPRRQGEWPVQLQLQRNTTITWERLWNREAPGWRTKRRRRRRRNRPTIMPLSLVRWEMSFPTGRGLATNEDDTGRIGIVSHWTWPTTTTTRRRKREGVGQTTTWA